MILQYKLRMSYHAIRLFFKYRGEDNPKEYKTLHYKVDQLQAELAKKDEQLESANEVIGFYADKLNWTYYDVHSWSSGDSTPKSDTECLENCGQVGSKYYGGKRAREYKKKWEGEE